MCNTGFVFARLLKICRNPFISLRFAYGDKIEDEKCNSHYDAYASDNNTDNDQGAGHVLVHRCPTISWGGTYSVKYIRMEVHGRIIPCYTYENKEGGESSCFRRELNNIVQVKNHVF